MGGEFRRARLDVFYQINKRGSFVFDGTRGPWSADASLSGNLRSVADFLAGYPSNSSGAVIVLGDLQRDYYQNSFDWWAHDTVRVSPKLSLNFGVRYTYHGVLHDAKNNVTTFVPSAGFVGPGSGIDSLYPKDLNNFAPRFGFAYTPTRNGKTVIRGGWGLFYDVPALNFFVANTGLPNGGAAGVNANPGGPNPVYTITARNVVFQPGVPVFGSAGPVPPYGGFGISQDFRTPYVQNFNLNIQRQLSSDDDSAGGLCRQPGPQTGRASRHQPADWRRPPLRGPVSDAGRHRHRFLVVQFQLQLPPDAVAAIGVEGSGGNLQLYLRPRHRQHERRAQYRADEQLRPEETSAATAPSISATS